MVEKSSRKNNKKVKKQLKMNEIDRWGLTLKNAGLKLSHTNESRSSMPNEYESKIDRLGLTLKKAGLELSHTNESMCFQVCQTNMNQNDRWGLKFTKCRT